MGFSINIEGKAHGGEQMYGDQVEERGEVRRAGWRNTVNLKLKPESTNASRASQVTQCLSESL